MYTNIVCELFGRDLEIINGLTPMITKMLGYEVEITSKRLVADEDNEEWIGEPYDDYEVTFRMKSMNHFWALGQYIGRYKQQNNIS